MGYSKSFSRKVADNYIMDLKKKIFISTKISYELQQLSYRIGVIQTSAILEEYLKTVFEDWISLMKLDNTKMDKLPNNIWLWCLIKAQSEHMKELFLSKSEAKLLKNLSKNPIIMNTIKGDNDINGIVYPNDMIKDKKFPSSENIKALFHRFGIDDIFKQIEIRFHKNIQHSIESFLFKRNEIAHVYPSQDLTKIDLEEHIKQILLFINYIDRIIFTHVITHTSEICWKK